MSSAKTIYLMNGSQVTAIAVNCRIERGVYIGFSSALGGHKVWQIPATAVKKFDGKWISGSFKRLN